MEYHCPNCGSPLTFQSSVSIYTTCTHCRSMVVRHDMDLEKLGEVSELLNDMSPFQVGTTGTHRGVDFMLLGRIKLVYPNGTWSEWYAMFNDGREGWLAEAQGHYMMSYQAEVGNVPAPEDLPVGAKLDLSGIQFKVNDRRKVRYAGSEGELPFIFKPNAEVYSIDLKAKGGLFASILYEPDGPQVFTGKYESFDSFNFQMLKELHGWERK